MSTAKARNAETSSASEAAKCFGVEFFQLGQKAIITSRDQDLYTYKTFIGKHEVPVEKGDCVYYYDDHDMAHVVVGPTTVHSTLIATIIRGYTPPSRSSVVGNSTNLPYVNGCSTRQVFPPERVGDPTLQILLIPPYCGEQAHHIHSTARIVHILEGHGRCVIGTHKLTSRHELVPGMSLVLHPMCPHHFETDEESLLVLPLHVYSSPPSGIEYLHPMFSGTHLINQGH